MDKDLSLPAQRRQQLDFVAKGGGLVAAEYEDGGISGRRLAGCEQFLAAITVWPGKDGLDMVVAL